MREKLKKTKENIKKGEREKKERKKEGISQGSVRAHGRYTHLICKYSM